MTVHHADDRVTLHHGDCIEVLRGLADCSVDAVVTDPPYGLEFMGKEWDSFRQSNTGPQHTDFKNLGPLPTFSPNRRNQKCPECGRWAYDHKGRKCECGGWKQPARLGYATAFQSWCQTWAAECLRVLKPGGHLLAFGGTRTWHRLACAIEDAGFEVRDSIGYFGSSLAWVYASGFPKSHSVNKALDDRICRCEAVPYGYDNVSREGVPSVRDAVDADHPLPVGAKQDLLGDMRGESRRTGEQSPVAAQVGATDVPGLRGAIPPLTDEAAGQSTTGLLPQVSGDQGRGPAATGGGDGPVRLDGPEPSVLRREDDRPEQPRMEGRRDFPQGEGELHRPEVRPVSGRPAGDGASRRVRDGAPTRHGALDRSAAPADRGGQSQGSRPAEQRAGEPGAVPVERGSQAWGGWPVCKRCGKPSLPAGLGTALKPAHEPIVVARKPLAGTVAGNVLAYGTGALNIDATRIHTAGSEAKSYKVKRMKPGATLEKTGGNWRPDDDTDLPWDVGREYEGTTTTGRWPANVTLDEHTAAEVDRQSGVRPAGSPKTGDEPKAAAFSGNLYGTAAANGAAFDGYGDTGGASRFFYTAKAPTHERPRTDDGTAHPTVKPLDLMRWLVRLVTPPGGTVLDPFAGSGTTAEACVIEGFRCITIEREDDYLPLIVQRLTKPIQPDLFGGAE